METPEKGHACEHFEAPVVSSLETFNVCREESHDTSDTPCASRVLHEDSLENGRVEANECDTLF